MSLVFGAAVAVGAGVVLMGIKNRRVSVKPPNSVHQEVDWSAWKRKRTSDALRVEIPPHTIVKQEQIIDREGRLRIDLYLTNHTIVTLYPVTDGSLKRRVPNLLNPVPISSVGTGRRPKFVTV